MGLVKQPDSEYSRLFPDRTSRVAFIIRVVALMAMSGVLAAFGLMGNVAPRTSVTSPPRPRDSAASLQPSEFLVKLDASGRLSEDAVAISDDGLALLRLSQGSKVLDAQQQPLTSIRVMAKELPLRNDIGLIGTGYEFGPAGATMNPPASLTFTFDPQAFYPFRYQDIDCSRIHMAYYLGDRSSPPWRVPWLDVSLDLTTHSATTKVDHLGTFILFCEVLREPQS